VGDLLQYYKSGHIPKAFKIIPSLKNWEQILLLTKPASWSPQATALATKLFASNLKDKMAQRFFNLVLLPKFRADIEKYKKLNYHYMFALRKSLFKPGAFFKGFLLPLAQDDCTAREAVILSHLLRKSSIPSLHAGVAVMKILEMPYSGPRFLLMKTLLNKKYSLPRKVVEFVAQKFCEYKNDSRELPVVWHQALLILAQRYRNSLSPELKEDLKALMRVHTHHVITGEIRRELFSAEKDADMNL
jgi:essential nuclear protein 1